MAKFENGNSGKPKGATNKITRSFKEALMEAFNELQQDPKANLITWGKANPSYFYTIASKLIPAEINAKVEGKIITVIVPE